MRWHGSTGWWILMPIVMFGTWAAVTWVAATFLRPHRGATTAERHDQPGPKAIIGDPEYHLRLVTLRGSQKGNLG